MVSFLPVKLEVTAVTFDVPIGTVVGSPPEEQAGAMAALSNPSPHSAKKEKHLITVGLSGVTRILHVVYTNPNV